jgi:hypothetical protein
VPAGGINVADARSIQNYSQIFFNDGQVDYNAVDFWNRKFTAINPIWLKLSIFFKFYKPFNFYIFIFILFFFYIYFFLIVAFLNKHLIDFIIISFAFFSTSSFYLIERGNFDLLLFGFIILLNSLSRIRYQLPLILLLTFLKINLVYLFYLLIKNYKSFLWVTLLSFLVILFNYKYIWAGYSDIGNAASLIHYGIFTIIKSILRVAQTKISFDINQYTFILSFTLIIFYLCFSFIYLYKEILIKKINIFTMNINLNLTEKFFITGSLFYIFSFISFSAPDYKLVFLIPALPLLLLNKKKYKFLILTIFVVMNSCLFETYPLFVNLFKDQVIIPVNNLSYRYLILGLLMHLLKIALFLMLLFEVKSIYFKKLSNL